MWNDAQVFFTKGSDANVPRKEQNILNFVLPAFVDENVPYVPAVHCLSFIIFSKILHTGKCKIPFFKNKARLQVI